jgi:hypothetical protein
MAGLAPGGGGAGKGKEITPKRIFSKAQPLDAQYVVPFRSVSFHAFGLSRIIANILSFLILLYRSSSSLSRRLLLLKMQDEAKALALCQQKVKQKALPMEVVDAEFQVCLPSPLFPFFLCRLQRHELTNVLSDSTNVQWDRRKLTFYFVAERRIDFRELVRELFRRKRTLLLPH